MNPETGSTKTKAMCGEKMKKEATKKSSRANSAVSPDFFPYRKRRLMPGDNIAAGPATLEHAFRVLDSGQLIVEEPGNGLQVALAILALKRFFFDPFVRSDHDFNFVRTQLL